MVGFSSFGTGNAYPQRKSSAGGRGDDFHADPTEIRLIRIVRLVAHESGWSSSAQTVRPMLMPSVRILFRKLPRVMPKIRAACN